MGPPRRIPHVFDRAVIIPALLLSAPCMNAAAAEVFTGSGHAGDHGDVDGAGPSPSLPLFGDLPPPLSAIPPAEAPVHYLELVLNGRRTGIISPVEMRGGDFLLPSRDLQRAGVIFPASRNNNDNSNSNSNSNSNNNSAILAISDLAGSTSQYHAADQMLYIDLPTSYLPAQRFGGARARAIIMPAETAFLLNYDLFASVSGGGGPMLASAYHEARMTGQFGAISSTGIIRNRFGGGYRRYDTYFRSADADSATTWEAGDFITRSFSNASAVRLAGIQISRDFTVRPDIITYPMPDFSGRAALPSTVELLIDGRSISSTSVNPGPFALDMLPDNNGAGSAQLIVTDIHGNSIATTMPFYVSSSLLAPGLTDFAAAAGFFRKDYGFRNFSYGNFAASASLRHGITPSLTGELRAEATRHLLLGGTGIVTRIQRLGIISTSFAASHAYGRIGTQIALGYDYQAKAFSIALRHLRQSGEYQDLGTIHAPQSRTKRDISSAGLNFSAGALGSFGLSYATSHERGRPSARYANGHWSLPFASRARLSAQAGRDFASKGWFASLSATLSFGGDNSSINAAIMDQNGGHRSYRADYVRPVNSEGGLGWGLGGVASENGSKSWRGDMQWRGPAMQLRAGTYGFAGGSTAPGSQQYWASASGSLVLMGGDLFAANTLPGAFALVSTEGMGDIPVRYEHQLIGRTNSRGHLFIPSISPWYAGQFSIDPLGLPANAMVPEVERRAAIAAGRGARISFPIHITQPVLAELRDELGQPIAAGSSVFIAGTATTHIGWDGLLYLENLPLSSADAISIRQPDGRICTIDLPVKTITPDHWNVGEILCHTAP